MKKKIFRYCIITLFSFLFNTLHAANTDGWRIYNVFGTPQMVVKGSAQTYYVLASNHVFSCHLDDNSVQLLDKTNGLNDVTVTQMAWNTAVGRLLLVYDNQNMDVVDEKGNVFNMAYLRDYSAPLDKQITCIFMSGRYAFLGTGFGIVKVNMADATITDTYRLDFKVDNVEVENGFLVANSSTEGCFKADMKANLYDKSSWKHVGNYVPKPQTNYSELIDKVKNFIPDGPRYPYFGFMKVINGKLYTTPGGFVPLNNKDLPGHIQVWNGEKWQLIPDEDITKKTGYSFESNNVLVVDPLNENHFFVAGRTGVYEFLDGKFVQNYTQGTPGLYVAATLSDPNNLNYVIVQGLVYDRKGNLWLANSISPKSSLLEYTVDKQWVSHHDNRLMTADDRSFENMVSMMFDSRGLLWFTNYYFRETALVGYNTETGEMQVIKTFKNQDGYTLQPQFVKAVTEDREGNLWLSTSIGPLMLPPEEIGKTSPSFTQVKVPRNDGTNYADYLLHNIDVNQTVVDGGNRKWFATNGNGVYLVSADNVQEIHHFRAENSPLLSNVVESIAIDGATGTVYFGTDKGLCSFHNAVTEPAETMSQSTVSAYPNPVRPEYVGNITITGLQADSDVKIVATDGKLVKSGRSTGGSFIWDGNNAMGRRVPSGIYFVLAATPEGKNGVVCKIAVVN